MEASWYLLLERFPDDAERNRVEFNTYIIYIYIYKCVYIYRLHARCLLYRSFYQVAKTF